MYPLALKCRSMSSQDTYSTLGITRVYFAFCIIHQNYWAQMNKEIWIPCHYYAKTSHFPSKMKAGSECYRPLSFAQASILYTHLAYLWRTLLNTRNTQSSIEHYSSFKKAPAKSCHDLRNPNWISSLTFGGEKKAETKRLNQRNCFPYNTSEISFLYLVLFITLETKPMRGQCPLQS